MVSVFIDGCAGTTGLKIHERLSSRRDIKMIRLPDELRKDEKTRKEALNSCDVAFLCLPDAAAVEAVAMVDNSNTVIIDASTAHRTAPGWVYGFPEGFENGFEKVSGSKRIAVPGCHAVGFVALIKPLVDSGILSPKAALTCCSLTGYSGGGKQMIAEYEAEDRSPLLFAPRLYGLTQHHKHLKEMTAITKLENVPTFLPIVGDFYSGMLVTVTLPKDALSGTAEDIREEYKRRYRYGLVSYAKALDENGFIAANTLSGKDTMLVCAAGNDERITVLALFDNLGKGASGAAVECLNLVLGLAPDDSLITD